MILPQSIERPRFGLSGTHSLISVHLWYLNYSGDDRCHSTVLVVESEDIYEGNTTCQTKTEVATQRYLKLNEHTSVTISPQLQNRPQLPLSGTCDHIDMYLSLIHI